LDLAKVLSERNTYSFVLEMCEPQTIRNHQKPSETIRKQSKTTRNHQKPSKTHQKPIKNHQKTSETIKNYRTIDWFLDNFPIQKWQFRILLFFGSRPGADGTTGMSGLRLGQRLWWQ